MMSQRTIVEFNHDYAHEVHRVGEVIAELLWRAMCSGSRESWESLEPYGIRRIVQRHHSDGASVTINGYEYGEVDWGRPSP